MQYRAEIDGLRALAVAPVILFHAGFSVFSGGYVGVDVFFVISGYLITTIILQERAEGAFSFAGFYERRIRRILPALYTVILASIAIAWVVLLPGEMKSFGQAVSASVLFLANMFLVFRGNDYFGLGAENNPLLHLWSLAVEEQYYILLPPLLLAAWHFGKRRTAWVLAVLTLASLALAHAMTSRAPALSFFVLPTRAWELFVGSLVALYLSARPAPGSALTRQALSAIGLACILLAVFAFDGKTSYPSAYTAIPTIGAALIIVFGTAETFAGRILTTKAMVGVGLISYSAYLWHQPLFAFARVSAAAEPGRDVLVLLVLASIVLAYLTWRFIERPFRSRKFLTRPAVFGLAAGVGVLFVGFGVLGHYNSGYPARNELFARLDANYGLSLACNGNALVQAPCITSAAPQVAVLGDSFAMHLVEGLRSVYPANGVAQLTKDSCGPQAAQQPACSDFYRKALATIAGTASLKTVVVSSNFNGATDEAGRRALESTLAAVKGAGKEVVLVGPTPPAGRDMGRCAVAHEPQFAACDFARNSVPVLHFQKIDALKAAAAKHSAAFVDLTDAICDATTCRAVFGKTLVYRDGGHLSREGSRYVMERLYAWSAFPRDL